MPAKAQELWIQLGGPQVVSAQRFGDLGALDPTGWRVRKGAPLFPKAEAAP
jgi:methionyl-tRNA synthetase